MELIDTVGKRGIKINEISLFFLSCLSMFCRRSGKFQLSVYYMKGKQMEALAGRKPGSTLRVSTAEFTN